jgi:hypothetical protein
MNTEIFKFAAQYTIFDPSNREHRTIVYEFLRTKSWRHTNVRFVLERSYSDVIRMITEKLADYYMKNEFNFSKNEPTIHAGIGI